MSDEIVSTPSAGESASSSGDQALPTYRDGDVDLISNHSLPLVLSFPYKAQTGESKSQTIVREMSQNSSLVSRFSFGDVVVEEGQKLIERFHVAVVPTVAVLYRGKAVIMLSGDDIATEPLTEQCKKLLSILDSDENREESLTRLEAEAHQYAAKAGKRIASGEWQMVPLSGIVPGVVMAVARHHLDGMTWLLPTGLAYAICITNGNFRFNWFQKVVATGIMYAIGMHWKEILEWARPLFQN